MDAEEQLSLAEEEASSLEAQGKTSSELAKAKTYLEQAETRLREALIEVAREEARVSAYEENAAESGAKFAEHGPVLSATRARLAEANRLLWVAQAEADRALEQVLRREGESS